MTNPTRDEAVRDESKVTTAMIDAAFKVCPAGAISEIGTGGMQRMIAAALATAPAPASGGVDAGEPYPVRVAAACAVLFDGDPTDVAERRDRFAEEALEVVQAFGMSRDDMHALVDYTFGRPVGEPPKEIGAAMTTLASLANEAGYGLMECAEADLAKLMRPETIERIRAKRATRHGRGPLPGLSPAATPVSEAEPVAWMDDGSTRAGTGTEFRVVTAHTKAGMPKAAAEAYTTPLYLAKPAASPASPSGVLDLYREAVRVDVKMEGPQFMGCNTSALKRAWEADRASLASDAPPAPTSGSGDGGEIERLNRRLASQQALTEAARMRADRAEALAKPASEPRNVR